MDGPAGGGGSVGVEGKESGLRRPLGVVLVADDHPPLRAGVRLLLEEAGYRVVEAGSADAAVAAAAEHQPDVCLIDLGMPGNGRSAIERIFARNPAARIVVLTGSVEERDLFGAVRAGALGYLVKGIDDEALVEAVAAVIRGEAALPRRLLRLLVGGAARGGGGSTVARPGGGAAHLSPRETQVLAYLKDGLDTRGIAERLSLSPVTVRRHISSLLRKLDADSRRAAVEALDARPRRES